MSPEEYVSTVLQTPLEAFEGFVPSDILALRQTPASWNFGMELLNGVVSVIPADVRKIERFCVAKLNHGATNATWYKVPDEQDAYVIGINNGLVEVLKLIAGDIFGPGSDEQEVPLEFSSEVIRLATPRVRARIGAFLEIGFPLADAPPTPISSRRRSFVDALVADALRFAVLHELAHIFLLHDRAPQAILRNRYSNTAIAVFSMESEHQADELAIRFHAALRPDDHLKMPVLTFAGVVLFFGVLALFERLRNYDRVFDTPHHHPPAYERLYRLRLALTFGDGYKYWSVPEGNGLRLARMDLAPDGAAVEFGDYVAKTMLAVLRDVAKPGELFSPMNSLMNKFLDEAEANEEDAVRTTCDTLAKWVFLGSPDKVMQHLAELVVAAPSADKTEQDQEDYRRLKVLVERFVTKVRQVASANFDVRLALRRFDDFVHGRL